LREQVADLALERAHGWGSGVVGVLGECDEMCSSSGATMTQNIVQGLKSDRGKAMFKSFAQLDGPKKAALLDAAVKELSMTGCSMADIWRAAAADTEFGVRINMLIVSRCIKG
jgi:hypothetical protein